MADPREELPDLLSQALLGAPYDPNSTAPEKFLIDFLDERVEDWEQGLMSTADLLALFDREKITGFDIRTWLQDNVDAGNYDWPPADEGEEEGPTLDQSKEQEM